MAYIGVRRIPGFPQVNDIIYMLFRYRLAPEHWYPTPLNDCEAAARYFLTHAHKFGVDPARIAIVGKF